jgi:hypothetical protein
VDNGELWIRGVKVDNSHIDIPLDGPLAKLERAQEHLEALHAEVRLFFERNVYLATGEFDAQSGWHIFRLQPLWEPPPRIAVLIGEYAYQLRSTVEHVAFAVKRWQLNGGRWGPKKPPESLIVLFEQGRAGFNERAPKRLCGLPDDWKTLIERMQPYHRGENPGTKASHDPLAILDWLWNVDKHQTLIEGTIGAAPGARHLRIVAVPPCPTMDVKRVKHIDPERLSMHQDAEIARARIEGLRPHTQVYLEGTIPVRVNIKEGTLEVPGQPRPREQYPAELFTSLVSAGALIAGIVSTFPRGDVGLDLGLEDLFRGFTARLVAPRLVT